MEIYVIGGPFPLGDNQICSFTMVESISVIFDSTISMWTLVFFLLKTVITLSTQTIIYDQDRNSRLFQRFDHGRYPDRVIFAAGSFVSAIRNLIDRRYYYILSIN